MIEGKELRKLETEQVNEESKHIDRMSPEEIASLMNRQDLSVIEAVQREVSHIGRAISDAEDALRAGGRIFYIGAGTSGRLGVLDASECVPTFGVSPDTFIGIIAGGKRAVFEAVEGAEDDENQGAKDIKAQQLRKEDMVIGIAASGRTPYVIGALKYANSLGCRTASIACVSNSRIGQVASCAIEVVTGPEVISGSTRLKAGTAQKMVLNMISTGAMVRMGKVYENYMVDLTPTNEKLKARCINIFTDITGLSEEEANVYIAENDGNLKKAILSAKSARGMSEEDALEISDLTKDDLERD